MNRIILTLFLLFYFKLVIAQITIRGQVTGDNQKSIEFVLVSIQLDANFPVMAITDSAGNYEVKNLKTGKYKCAYKYVAYKDTILSFYLEHDTVVNLRYQNSLTIADVVITASKPVLQRKIDRIRFNVVNTDIVFGSNVWEVLGKTPLVNTSEQGEIVISGTAGASVYINDKKKVLSGEALMNYLRSIPAEKIEAIEVITTPPSKYDAEGGAGIINIVMKQNKEEGLLGNTSIRSSQATFNSQLGSFYLNYRKDKWNIYSDMSLNNINMQTLYKKNIYYPANSFDLNNRTITTTNGYQEQILGLNLGADYQINAKHVIGILLNYSGEHDKKRRDATSKDSYTHADSLSFTKNMDNQVANTYSLNANYQGILDSLGKKINIDVDFLNYIYSIQSNSNTDIISVETGDILSNRSWFRSTSPQYIHNQSAKLDFDCPINDKISFETGIKTAFSTINNDFVFENKITTITWEKDSLRSNLFKYKETLNSIYAIINHKLNDKWAYQFGTRIENTIATGWLNGNKAVDRNYVNIFPTAFLKYIYNKQNNFVLAVTSRIRRPSFWDVNPFRTYTTDKAYFEGNPFLLPSKYYRQELTYTFKNTYIFQAGCSQLLGEFYALPYNPSGDIIVNKKVNYGNKYSFFGSTTFNKQLMPWWRLTSSILTAYLISKGDYADIVIDNRSFLLTITANQTFNLSKKKGLSCTVIANNTFPFTVVNNRVGNRLVTEVLLRKSIRQLNLSFSAKDLLKSNKDNYNIHLNNLNIIDQNYHDTRSISLALSYNFGKSTVKDKRKRESGNDAEKQRLQ